MGGGMSTRNRVAPAADKETQEQRQQLLDDMSQARKDLKVLQDTIRAMKRHVEQFSSSAPCQTCGHTEKGACLCSSCESVMSMSFESLRSKLEDSQGVHVDNASRCIYLPFDAPLTGALVLGLDYKNPAPIYKVYKIDSRPDMFVDVVSVSTGSGGVQLKRDIYPDGRVLLDGLVAYEEITLDESTDPSSGKALTVLVYNTKITMKTNVWEVAKSCGWKGMMNFEQASGNLKGVGVDSKNRDIYMPVIPDELIVIADYQATGMAIKLGVLDVPANKGKGHDLSITSGKDIKKASEVHNPPRRALGDKYTFSQTFALIDVPFGTNFNQMSLFQYDLVDKREYPVTQVIQRLLQ